MLIVQVILIGFVAALLITLIKAYQPTIALVLLIITTCLLFYFILAPVTEIISLLRDLANQYRINFIYLDTVFQIIGIAYLTELGAQLTNDAGLGSIASKIELVGKVLILIVSVPVLTAVIEAIIRFIPQ
ncbi:stage III sporulation protein AD [Amphibacillus marinus]|uniref:Stage III sporulation protein AD n=1 Tax=Amphibacillus marinus TaxID=872970 RepID=A0A1H8NLL5_9BACI|nr:stage III sporulation protein AD [Amphibacillus marinus]SEO30514.1 stage III sporulation protein AD [Amphibacillus marinus]